MAAALDLRPAVAPDVRTTAVPDSPKTIPPTYGATAGTRLAWEAAEYHLQAKPLVWYAVFGAALAALLFIAFLLRSFLSGVVFALVGLLILLYSERPPRTIRFQLTDNALLINTNRYPFTDLEAFNVIESPRGMLALLRSRRLILPLIHVPLGSQDPDIVRGILRERVTEDPVLHEPLPDLLAHWLGF